MSRISLAERVSALEQEVSRLKTEGRGPSWERVIGSFEGDPALLEAMRLGRKYRESLRPKRGKGRRRRVRLGH